MHSRNIVDTIYDTTNASSLPSQVVYKTNDDHVTVIGAGVTLHEALAAAEQLKKGTKIERNRKTHKGIKTSFISYELPVGLRCILHYPLSVFRKN